MSSHFSRCFFLDIGAHLLVLNNWELSRLEKEYDVVIYIGQWDGKAYILGKKNRTEAARDAGCHHLNDL